MLENMYVDAFVVCSTKTQIKEKLPEATSLEMPDMRWRSSESASTVALARTKDGFDTITTWVDRLTRRTHSSPSCTTDTAVDVSNAFSERIFSQHGLSDNVVSDRDPRFVSKFWKHLLSHCPVKLKSSTSKRSQTDEVLEAMIKMAENYIRCYCYYRQNDWDKVLTAAEFAKNSPNSEELGMLLFVLDLDWNPKSVFHLLVKQETSLKGIDDFGLALKKSLEDDELPYQISKVRQSAY